MNHRDTLRGLYVITNSTLAAEQDLTDQVASALQGGARIIQYRDKHSNAPCRLDQARRLRKLTHSYASLLIINDDVDLALAVQADGVHLGRQDTALAQAREKLGPHAVIGVSCYNRLALARQAKQAGADYIAFGRFFPSQTKPEAVQAEPELLRQARRELQLPLVAIGGITPENGASLITAGADMLAVIHAVFGQPDIRKACEHFRTLFQPEDSTP
mgnify:CR=1 FL=1